MEADELIEIKAGSKLTINGEKLVQISKDKNAVKLKNKISVIGMKSPFGLGMGVPETIKGGEPVTIKNTGMGVKDKKLTDQQSKINEMFRGDQFKAENSFSASIDPQLKSDLAQVNKNCTCVFEENIKKTTVKKTDGYPKRFNDTEKKLYEQLLEERKNVPPITDHTILQKAIPKGTVDGYIKNGWPTAQNCAAKAEDAAPYLANAEGAYKNLRLDYAGSPYKSMSETGDSVYVMRFKAIVDQDKIKLPDRTNGNPPPCTGTVFTGADDELIPEVTLVEGGLPITAGAIYEIDSNGNEYMVAYWNTKDKNFESV